MATKKSTKKVKETISFQEALDKKYHELISEIQSFEEDPKVKGQVVYSDSEMGSDDESETHEVTVTKRFEVNGDPVSYIEVDLKVTRYVEKDS